MKLKYTKEFLKNLEEILQNNKSFSNKIEKIIFSFKND
jgi:Txe/YoeB family toxin of Txe-Axe toxin-antitoxin module